MPLYNCPACQTRAKYNSLRRQIEDYESGRKYQKLNEEIDNLNRRLEKAAEREKQVRAKLKLAEESERASRRERRELERELARAHKHVEQAMKDIINLKNEIAASDQKRAYLESVIAEKEAEIENLRKESDQRVQEVNDKKDAEIEELKKQVDLLQKALHKANGENSGIPTRKTEVGKKKVIPATERGKGKTKGGQPGHPVHLPKQLDKDDPEVTPENHYPSSIICPCCGKEMEYLRYIRKDEVDLIVKLEKKIHYFHEYGCKDCGKKIHEEIPERLSGPLSYGPVIQSLILYLVEKGNVTLEQSVKTVSFLVNGEINPSSAYAAKLVVRAAGYLKDFMNDLELAILSQPLLFWDDTVINIMTHQGCLRFYGTEKLALYRAHWTKGMDTIEKDGILAYLDKLVFVMHDHVSSPYNVKFVFSNLDCIVHLIRAIVYLKEISKHKWLDDILEITRKAIDDRKKEIEKGVRSFDEKYLADFWEKYRNAIKLGYNESANDKKAYYHDDECALLARLQNYTANYFAWLVCFDLPTTDNLSERNLRFIKTKLAVSGQFESEDSVIDFSIVQSYIRTCEKNNIDLADALKRLFEGNPYTIEEILSPEDLDRLHKYKEKIASVKVEPEAETEQSNTFADTSIPAEELQAKIYEFMSHPHTVDEMTDILSARGDVKKMFSSKEIQEYEPEEPMEDNIPDEQPPASMEEAEAAEPANQKKKSKKPPMEPIRRKPKKPNGRPRKNLTASPPSGAPPG